MAARPSPVQGVAGTGRAAGSGVTGDAGAAHMRGWPDPAAPDGEGIAGIETMSDLLPRAHPGQYRLRLILSALRDGVILIEPDGTIAWANRAALRMHGLRRAADLGGTVSGYRALFELHDGSRRLPGGQHPMVRLLAGEAFEAVVEVAPAGGSGARWTHRVRGLVLDDAAGAPDGFVLILSDESGRLDAERRFESDFAANPAPATVLRLSDHRHIRVNRGFLEMTGYSEAQVVGHSAYEIDVLEGAARREFAIERLQQGRTVPQMEAVLQLPGGGEKRVMVAGQPVEVGDAACMLFSFVDLEPHGRTERALRHSEARFAAAFRLSPVPTFVAERQGCRLLLANDAFARESGHTVPELIGRGAGELGLWADETAGHALERRLRAEGSVQELDMTLRTKDGRAIACRVSAEAVVIGDRDCVLVVAQDVTEQRRTEGEVVAAIEAVMQDTAWFSRVVLERLARLRRAETPDGAALAELGDLPQRAREVLGLVCRGMEDAGIALALGITRNTVRNHVTALYRRTGVNNRTALLIWARERGFDGSPPRTTRRAAGTVDGSAQAAGVSAEDRSARPGVKPPPP